MEKIESLTPEQEQLLEVYKQKWIDKGLNTDRLDPKVCQEVSDYYYEKILNKPKVPILIKENPHTTWLAVCEYGNDGVTENFVYPYLDGNLMSGYFAFYDYCNEVLGIEYCEEYEWYKKTTECSLIYPLDDICIFCEKPLEINLKDGQLHAEGKPSIKYEGDWNVYSLNGIRVPKYLAMTPSGLLDLEFFKSKEHLADVKTEFIRKYGIDRMISLGIEVDTYKNYDNKDWNESEYKLIDMAPIFEERISYAPHVYMKNLTTGVYHLEGVAPECKNLIDAFKFREYKDFDDYDTLFIK